MTEQHNKAKTTVVTWTCATYERYRITKNITGSQVVKDQEEAVEEMDGLYFIEEDFRRAGVLYKGKQQETKNDSG